MAGANAGKAKFASLLLLFQGILLILFVVFVDYGSELLPTDIGKGKKKNATETTGKTLLVFTHLCFTGFLDLTGHLGQVFISLVR